MTEQERRRKNVVIALYMDAEVITKGCYTPFYRIENKFFGYDFSLKFHSDWNWIMPVYDKLVRELKEFERKIQETQFSVEKLNKIKFIIDEIFVLQNFIINLLIENAFDKISDLIEWYNKNKNIA